MSLFHRNSGAVDADAIDPAEPEREASETTEPAAYDAQSDLALPANDVSVLDDGFAPGAGLLVPDAEPAAYDVGRDVGI